MYLHSRFSPHLMANIHFCAVEQGLHELRKLGIEQLLWELSRHEVNPSKGEETNVITKGDMSDGEDLT
jgi:hypothetical protein